MIKDENLFGIWNKVEVTFLNWYIHRNVVQTRDFKAKRIITKHHNFSNVTSISKYSFCHNIFVHWNKIETFAFHHDYESGYTRYSFCNNGFACTFSNKPLLNLEAKSVATDTCWINCVLMWHSGNHCDSVSSKNDQAVTITKPQECC